VHVSSKQENRDEGGSLEFVAFVLRGGDGGLYWRSNPTEKTLDALLSITDEDERG
jgi:hypothetical protein